MTEPLSHVVLRRVARYYREHPSSWYREQGDLYGLVADHLGNPLPDPPCDPDKKQGCIHTMILYQAAVCAGPQASAQTAYEAVRVLCEHHDLKAGVDSIFAFNDKRCKTVEEAIAFVEAPLAGKSAQAPRLGDIQATIGAPSMQPAAPPPKLYLGSILLAGFILGFAVVSEWKWS